MDGNPPDEIVDGIEQVPSARDRISGPDFFKNSFSYGTLVEGYNVWGQGEECNIFDKGGRKNGRRFNCTKKRSNLKVNCFNCDKFGHMNRDSPDMKGPDKDDKDAVPAFGESRLLGCLIDSGATVQMTPQ